ncbi:MAG: ribonuclease D [Cyanobacteriota/Melainabacteria group bacterium]
MHIITKSAELKPLLDLIDEHKTVCLDLEFVPERTYFPVLCLIQCCVDGKPFIIDPFECKELNELWQRVTAPDVKAIFHAASQDLNIIFQESGLIPENVFDTQIAAGFAGYGYSAGYRKLLQEVLSITIPKTESFSDWQARPLSDSQMEYAVNDVLHLEPLARKLEKQLEDAGRLDWVLEECKSYEEKELYLPDRSRDFLKIKGASKLNSRALAVLRELWCFRDEEARGQNKPPRLILQDNLMIEVARRQTRSLGNLKKMRGIRIDQVNRWGDDIIDCVERGLALPGSECPTIPTGKAPHRSEIISSDFIYLLLKIFADELELATEHLATRDEIQSLVRLDADRMVDEHEDIRLTRGWRRMAVGQRIIDIIEGAEVKLSITNRKSSPRSLNVDFLQD